MNHYIFIIYLALPAFAANMLPVVAAKLKILKNLNFSPTRGLTLNQKKILGENKTVRGFLVGIIGAIIVSLIQFYISQKNLTATPYLNSYNQAAMFGLLAGFGALLGDAIKSFFKRQLSIKPSKPFIPFDQIDYIIGFVVLTALIINWQINDVIFLIIFALIANPLVNLTAYAVGIKKTYW